MDHKHIGWLYGKVSSCSPNIERYLLDQDIVALYTFDLLWDKHKLNGAIDICFRKGPTLLVSGAVTANFFLQALVGTFRIPHCRMRALSLEMVCKMKFCYRFGKKINLDLYTFYKWPWLSIRNQIKFRTAQSMSPG